MPKPLSAALPYPSAESICHDAFALSILSPAYASPTGELNTILQYVYHAMLFDGNGYGDIAQTLKGIAVSEMLHLELLGKTIYALGAAPVFAQFPSTCFNFYSAKYVSYSRTLKDMLEDDIIGERRAVAMYAGMVKRLHNERVKRIAARLLEDEKLHLETLEGILGAFKG